MSNVLVRGIPEKVRRRIDKMARQENLSSNQLMVRLITQAIEKADLEREEEERRSEAFRGIERLREKIYKKYGKQEDSTKIIRQMRDERAKRFE